MCAALVCCVLSVINETVSERRSPLNVCIATDGEVITLNVACRESFAFELVLHLHILFMTVIVSVDSVLSITFIFIVIIVIQRFLVSNLNFSHLNVRIQPSEVSVSYLMQLQTHLHVESLSMFTVISRW